MPRIFWPRRKSCPCPVLLDWELPGLAAVDLLFALGGACSDLLVIALSGRPDARQAALSAGADAFLSRADPPERFLVAIDDCRHRWHRRSASSPTRNRRSGS